MSTSQNTGPDAPKPPVSSLEYLIGWICILPNEYYEAIKMFDERYDTTHIVRGRGDKNSYDVGRVGNHFVVMNCPASGTNGQIHAAKIASDMRSTFPAIRFVFLVGIGGGSPSKRDVRLGDVVLGVKVVPYMQGKQTDNGFVINGDAGAPPEILLTAITRLGAELRQGLNLQKAIELIGPKAIERPEKDNLYKSSYIHCGRCDCVKSEAKAYGEMRHRSPRDGDLVQMHQGIVGSADQVMKNASYRDEYAASYDIICFEMEAIGVMQTTSCITIRGISDYSDGHKNDEWHSYASLSAAVCAKELLKIISAQSLAECPMEITQDELVRSVKGAVYQVNCSIHQSPGPQKEYQTAQRNHDAIVERYGLVQDLIVPRLYELTQENGLEDLEKVRDKVAEMESLQQDLKQSLESIRIQVRKQAKRRQNSDAMRENWKVLKHKIDDSSRWVAEVSKVTHQVLASTASKSRRFFVMVGKKGNRTFQDAGHVIQDSSHHAIEHLKHLMEHFKAQFRANRKEITYMPPIEQNATHLTDLENIPSPFDKEMNHSNANQSSSSSSSSTQSDIKNGIRPTPPPEKGPPPYPSPRPSSSYFIDLNIPSSPPFVSLQMPTKSPPPIPLKPARISSGTIPQPKRQPPPPPPPRGSNNGRRVSEDESLSDAPSLSTGSSFEEERRGSIPRVDTPLTYNHSTSIYTMTPQGESESSEKTEVPGTSSLDHLRSPSVSELATKFQGQIMGRPRAKQMHFST